LGLKTIVVVSLFLAWKFYRPPVAATTTESPTVDAMRYDHARNKVTPVPSPTEAANKF
jgi:hypothetical protein